MKIALSLIALLLVAFAAAWFFFEPFIETPKQSGVLSGPEPETAIANAKDSLATANDAKTLYSEMSASEPGPSGSFSVALPPSTSFTDTTATSSPTKVSTGSSSGGTNESSAGGLGGTSTEEFVAVSASNIAYDIPAGMRAPVVFLPENRPITPPMERFLDDVRREFDATIAAADDPAEVWDNARRRADDRYRQLFGDDAYNQKTMQDAIDALRSKGSLPAPPSAPTPNPVLQ